MNDFRLIGPPINPVDQENLVIRWGWGNEHHKGDISVGQQAGQFDQSTDSESIVIGSSAAQTLQKTESIYIGSAAQSLQKTGSIYKTFLETFLELFF